MDKDSTLNEKYFIECFFKEWHALDSVVLKQIQGLYEKYLKMWIRHLSVEVMAAMNVDEDIEVRIWATQFEIKYYEALVHSKQCQTTSFSVKNSKSHFSLYYVCSCVYMVTTPITIMII